MEKITEDRLAKLSSIRALGVNPYPYHYRGRDEVSAVIKRFEAEGEGQACIAGRITAMRHHGKSAFLDIQDFSGKIQAYLQKNLLGEENFELYRLLDMGDIIGLKGKVDRTRAGEVTVFAEDLTLLSKALSPLPEKFHGLRDREICYRKRYLDLISNKDSMDSFVARSRIMKDIREFFEGRGFLEVETPMMHPIAGGAAARPFSTYHNTLKMDLFLRIAPELYLKRLLVGGMERVYEVNRNFRNEGISPRHNPEFTMLEAYQAYADYNDMMSLTENLFLFLFEKYRAASRFQYGERSVTVSSPFTRKTYGGLFKEHTGVEITDENGIRSLAKEMALEVENLESMEPIKIAQEIFEDKVEPTLIDPTFVIDYPKAICPLAKEKEGTPEIAERFELFLCGMELANAFSELNDPIDQEERFKAQVASHDEEAPRQVDYDYVQALMQGLPPAGGLGIGIDRLIMILMDRPSIRDVILFPLLRPEVKAAAEGQEGEEEGTDE